MSTAERSFRKATLNQIVGYVFGAVYLVVGAVGFAVTTGVDFFARNGDELIVFELNPLHNVVHLAIGAALVGAAALSARASRDVNLAVGVTYLAVGIAGFFATGADWNYLALNTADNGLHLLSAAILLGIALRPEVQRRLPHDEKLGTVSEAEVRQTTTSGPTATAGERPAGDVRQADDVRRDAAERRTSGGPTGRDRPQTVAEELGLLRPGEAAPVSGVYICDGDEQTVEVSHGDTIPPCPGASSGDTTAHRFRLLERTG